MNSIVAHQILEDSRNDVNLLSREDRKTFEASFPLESFQTPRVLSKIPSSPPPLEHRRSIEPREGFTDSTSFRSSQFMESLLMPDFNDKNEQSKSRRTSQICLRPRKRLRPSYTSSTPYSSLLIQDDNQIVIISPPALKNVESKCSLSKRKCSLDNIVCPTLIRPPIKMIRRSSKSALSA